MPTTNILDLNNRIDKIEKTGIGSAAETSYSNTTSGLSATNVQSAIDEIDGATDNMSSAITDIEGDILAIEGDVEDLQESDAAINTNILLCGGKNLIEYPYKDSTKTSAGITFTDNGDGTISISGKSSSTGNVWFNSTDVNVFLEANKKYTFYTNVENDDIYIALQNVLGGSVNSFYATVNGTEVITTTDGYYRLQIGVKPTGDFASPVLIKPLLVYENVSGTFAPFALPNDILTKRLTCNESTAGTYKLTATVDSNGGVTYEWVLDT